MSVGMSKKRYYAIFLIKQENTYNVLRRKRFSPDNPIVRFKKGKAKPIKIDSPTYSRGLKVFYFVDINEGQLFFKNTKGSGVNAELIDMIMEQGIIKQLTANLSEKFLGGQLLMIIMSFFMGGFLGFIIAGFL